MPYLKNLINDNRRTVHAIVQNTGLAPARDSMAVPYVESLNQNREVTNNQWSAKDSINLQEPETFAENRQISVQDKLQANLTENGEAPASRFISIEQKNRKKQQFPRARADESARRLPENHEALEQKTPLRGNETKNPVRNRQKPPGNKQSISSLPTRSFAGALQPARKIVTVEVPQKHETLFQTNKINSVDKCRAGEIFEKEKSLPLSRPSERMEIEQGNSLHHGSPKSFLKPVAEHRQIQPFSEPRAKLEKDYLHHSPAKELPSRYVHDAAIPATGHEMIKPPVKLAAIPPALPTPASQSPKKKGQHVQEKRRQRSGNNPPQSRRIKRFNAPPSLRPGELVERYYLSRF